MAKAKFDIKDLKTEATRTLHAGVGAADLAVETVKTYVTEAQKRVEGVQKDAQKRLADVQKSVKGFEFQPKAFRSQATTVVNARVDELSKEAATRRDLVEKRVAALQADAQKFVTANVETATDTYETLAKRGETVVRKFRKDTAQTVAPADNVVRNKTSVKPAAAKKAPAKKTTAKKTTKKATAKSAS
jgi:heparin binding hemagglutinin HbhA